MNFDVASAPSNLESLHTILDMRGKGFKALSQTNHVCVGVEISL